MLSYSSGRSRSSLPCSHRSIDLFMTASARSHCSASITSSRSTSRRPSESGATTCCRCCTAIGWVAKADVKTDRKEGVLTVPALHMEDGAAAADVDASRSELQALAEWLKLDKLKIKRTIKGH